MRVRWIITLIAALQSVPATSASAPLEAAGPWSVDYEDTQCLASRDYGSADRPLTLTLVPSITNSAMRVLFVRHGRTPQTQQEARLNLGTTGVINTFAFVYEVAQNSHRIVSVNIPMAQFRAAATSELIGIDSGDLKANLAVNMLPQVLAELDKCIIDLQHRWNITFPLPRPDDTHPAAGAGNFRPIFSSADYPAVALYHRQTGVVGVSLLIDETGKVADCSVDQPSGVGILDVATCVLLTNRARFLPATDSSGKPQRGGFATTVTWKLAP